MAQCAQPISLDDTEGSNRPPAIKSLTVDPPALVLGSWVTVRVEAEDPDGDALRYRWSANAGDVFGEGAEVRYTASNCCVGFNIVRVIVEDGRGGSTTKSIDVFVQ